MNKLGSVKIRTPERVEAMYRADGKLHHEIVPWRRLRAFLNRHAEAYYFDPRDELVDPEKRKRAAPGWLAEGFRERTGHTVTPRQEIAVENMTVAARWIENGILERDAIRVIRHELAAFLDEAGLSGDNYEIPEDMYDPWNVLHSASGTYHDIETWEQGKVGAPTAAFRVAQFIHDFWFIACQTAVERDSGKDVFRKKGALSNKQKASARRRRLLEQAQKIRSLNPGKSALDTCRIIAERECGGEADDKAIHRIYKIVRPLLKKTSK
jgi:hypothetical protein